MLFKSKNQFDPFILLYVNFSVTLNTEDGDLLLDYSKNLVDENVMANLLQLVSTDSV